MDHSNADFSGWATKAGLKCSDGRVIMREAFAHDDQKTTVPLVWMHGHDEITNVLGHAVLEHRDEGVYAYAYLNDSPVGQHAKTLVQHGDVVSLSIFANRLKEESKRVMHGVIREVSMVITGANPGALIENVRLAHNDGTIDTLDDEAVISMGEGAEVQHGDQKKTEVVETTDDEVKHEDTAGDSNETLEDVLDTLNEKQKEAVNYVVGAALELQKEELAAAKHSDNDNSTTESEDTVSDDKTTEAGGNLAHKEGNDTTMSRNVFDQSGATGTATRKATISHSDFKELMADAQKLGSFKQALLQHADGLTETYKDTLAHAFPENEAGDTVTYGIADIEFLFPEAKLEAQGLQLHSRRMEWVQTVLDGTKKLPFSKVRTLVADITADEARAKGYMKGNLKKEEVLTLLRRSTGPATIYKKQKLDRDDIIDIGNDMDIVAWLKVEIRLMLEEELARAILVGDGRPVNHEDKIKDPAGDQNGDGIRSIRLDDDFYAIKRELTANSEPKDLVKEMVRARASYRGSGSPTLYIAESLLTDIMLSEDKFGRDLYATQQELADKLRVAKIVPVDLFEEYEDLKAILVNLADYSIGTNKGGELTSFEDFDIDFNQHKYLQETRLSGGLNKPLSAIVFTRGEGTLVTLTAPSFDGTDDTITLPAITGVIWELNGVVTAAGDHVITEQTDVEAFTDETHYFANNITRSWTYTP